ncbi:MAG: hypothetical protein HZC37_31705 [Burkholderiales bacterium]|nr:hypothetical protein [Burkholderiales bacterium]
MSPPGHPNGEHRSAQPEGASVSMRRRSASGSTSACPPATASTTASTTAFALALCLSGAAALIYQVAWQRVLTQVIGSDAISMVLVVTIFMVCLGLGSELARHLVRGTPRAALLTYAAIEAGVALYGFVSVGLLRAANGRLGQGDSLAADFVLNLLLLAFPIIGMGLTTPLIVHVAKQRLDNLGRTVGRLYGWNIAGAAVGAVLAGLLLIEAFGLTGSARAAAALNGVAAAIALTALRRAGAAAPWGDAGAAAPWGDAGARATAAAPAGGHMPLRPALAAVLFGFGTLAIQIVYFRILASYFTLSTIVFPMVLCAYLVLMALGQRLGGGLADRHSGRLREVVLALFAAGAVLFMLALRLPPQWAAAADVLRFTTFNGQLLSAANAHLIGDPAVADVLWFSLALMLPVLFWAGLFPVMLRLVTTRVEAAGHRFARLYTLYTLGNVGGAFVCGTVLFDAFGTGGAAMVTVGVVAAGCLLLVAGTSGLPATAWLTLAAGVAAAALLPLDFHRRFRLDRYAVAEVFEGRTGVATVVPTDTFFTIVDFSRTASASALVRDPGPQDRYQAWRWNHTDLFALDPGFRPKTVLVIGIGHAYLIDAMLDLPFITKITVVDISAEVVAAVRAHTRTSAQRIFTDPRVEIVVADGRRFVQSALARGQHYDLIQNKINEPWHAGSSNLFTQEFFREKKRLLSPGGYLSTRPITGHLTDGVQVFGSALWGGHFHLYFKNGPATRPAAAVLTPDIAGAWAAELPGRPGSAVRPRREQPVAFFTEVPGALRSDISTDDWPSFEYYLLRQWRGTWVSPRSSLDAGRLGEHLRAVPVHGP